MRIIKFYVSANTIIINLTIVECKFWCEHDDEPDKAYNKSNHSGM